VERAGFWRRVAATLLDVVACGLVMLIIVVGVSVAMSDAPGHRDDYVSGIVAVLVVLAYTSTEVWLAATPGKLALGMRIGTAAGAPAGRWTLALRWSSKHFGYLLSLVYAITNDPVSYSLSGFMNTVVMVGCLQALDEDRRTWHDEWAGTAVLACRSRAAAGLPPPLPPAVAGGADGR